MAHDVTNIFSLVLDQIKHLLGLLVTVYEIVALFKSAEPSPSLLWT